MRFFDPDRSIGPDKFEHAGIFLVATAAFLAVGFPPLTVMLAALIVAAVFEFGQWDTARHVPGFHEGGSPTDPPVAGSVDLPFRAGFGFGLYDLAAAFAGSLIALFLWSIVRAITTSL